MKWVMSEVLVFLHMFIKQKRMCIFIMWKDFMLVVVPALVALSLAPLVAMEMNYELSQHCVYHDGNQCAGK